MTVTLKDIADKTGGTIECDGSMVITGLASLSDARSGDVSFLAKARYAHALTSTGASAVIVGRDWEGEAPCALLRVDNPDKAFMLAAELLVPPMPKAVPGVHPAAFVSDGVEVDPSASIGPMCVVEAGAKIGAGTVLMAGCYIGRESVVGADCLIYPNVSVRERVEIGDRAIIHCGAVIGSDGFGYVQEGLVWKKIPQVGTVIIGNDVEIGANAAIDRARFGATVIEDGVKIDNLVQIAHNVKVGANTAMAAQVGIAGSSVIGQNVQFGGQAGVAGHLSVGNHSVVGAQAGVTKDVPEKVFVSGYPAILHRDSMKMQANMMRVPHLKKKLADLEKKMKEFEDEAGGKSS